MFFVSSTWKRIQDAAVEPVSLEEAKDYLRIAQNSTRHDSFVNIAIKTARIQCESMAGRSFINTKWRLFGPVQQIPFYSGLKLVLPFHPIVSIDSVSYSVDNGQTFPVDSSSYIPILGIRGGFQFSPYYYLPQTYGAQTFFNVDYTAGYGENPSDIPATVKMAIMLLVSHYFEHRTTNEQIPDAVQNLLDTLGL